MIPREILKKIRQIELCTNRIVTETVGERACPGCSQRRPRRWHGRKETARTFPTSVARNVRGEGAPNGSRGGYAPQILLTPGRGFQPAKLSVNLAVANGNFWMVERKYAKKMPFFDVLSRFFAGLRQIYIPEIPSENPVEDLDTTRNTFNNRGLDFSNRKIAPRNRGMTCRNREINFKNSGSARSNMDVNYRNRGNPINNRGSASKNRGSASKNRGNASENRGNTFGISGAAIFFQECCQGVGEKILFA